MAGKFRGSLVAIEEGARLSVAVIGVGGLGVSVKVSGVGAAVGDAGRAVAAVGAGVALAVGFSQALIRIRLSKAVIMPRFFIVQSSRVTFTLGATNPLA